MTYVLALLVLLVLGLTVGVTTALLARWLGIPRKRRGGR